MIKPLRHLILCLTALPAFGTDALLPTEPATVAPVTPMADSGRILGVIPDYKTVEGTETSAAPLTTHDKFKLAFSDTTDPFTVVLAGFNAGIAHWQNDFPAFGQGGQGYAKRLGAGFADQAVGNYMTEAIFPTMFHEDPRYFRKGSGAKRERVRYALSRVLITRDDYGRDVFNRSEIFGNAVAAGISNLYCPAASRTLATTGEKFGVQIMSDAAFNVLLEFWPDMKHKFFHK